MDNNCSNISSSVLNMSDNKNGINEILSKGKMTKNTNFVKKKEKIPKSLRSNECFPKININYDNKETKNNFLVFKEDIKLNLLDILCYSKNSHKTKDIELYKLSDSFYRKRMDIVRVFTLLVITEKILIKNNKRKYLSLSINNSSELICHN